MKKIKKKKYTVIVAPHVQAKIDALPENVRKDFEKVLKKLQKNPEIGKPLTEKEARKMHKLYEKEKKEFDDKEKTRYIG